MIGSWVRREGFWLLDALRGGTIRQHLQDIQHKMKFGNSGEGQQEPSVQQELSVQEELETELTQLLSHAKNTTPFYRELADFPVVTKADFKEHYIAFQSDLFLNKPLHHMSTSGSTGTPFTANQDMNKRKRVLAEIIYFNELGGHKLGDRLLYLRVWNEKYQKSKVDLFKENLIAVDISRLEEETMSLIVKTLKQDNKIVSILGYGVTYKTLAKYLVAQGAQPSDFNLKALFNSSELLDNRSKQLLSETLGCKVYDRYSNMENGILAQTGHNSDEFLVNTAGYYLELLDLEEDKPAARGEVGRIVITDLYNYAMPMIRYDTGDMAVKLEEGTGAQSRFKSLQGRRTELLYNTEGKLLTPATMDFCIWKFVKIKQFQLIQEGAFDYRVKVNGSEKAYPAASILAEFKKFLGSDANIALEFVDEIPVTASGKFKGTISHYIYDERNYSKQDV